MTTTSRSSSKEKKEKSWHKKIAANRGERWLKNVLAGRRDALLNPSNIRLFRLKLNIHQEAIAKKLNVSESTFGSIERGKRKVSKQLAQQIAAILGTSDHKLFKFVKHDKYIAIIAKSSI